MISAARANHIRANYWKKNKKIAVNVLKASIILFLVILIVGFTGMNKTSAQTEGTGTGKFGLAYERIVVQPGDTLWDLAVKKGSGDPNSVITEIMIFNKLKNAYIEAGQTIYIPVNKQ